jgi:hypothetical protein
MKQTTTLLRGGQLVAKVIPVTKYSVTGEELSKLWEGKPRISTENGEDWLNLIKEIRSEQKLPDIKWD